MKSPVREEDHRDSPSKGPRRRRSNRSSAGVPSPGRGAKRDVLTLEKQKM